MPKNTMASILFASSALCALFAISAQGSQPPKKTPQLLKKGKEVFQTNCVGCHGEKGDGMGETGQYMSPKPRNFATGKFKNGETVADVFASVTKGLDGTGMVGFPAISDADRWAVSYYVLTFKGEK